MACRRRPRTGFSLIELLIVIALMGILAGVVLPNGNPTIYEQLHSAARILATDLAYARSLAVTHGSTYRVTFDAQENRYVLRHSGTVAALDRLPASPFRDPTDPPDAHLVDLDDLPHLGAPVQLAGIGAATGTPQQTGEVEFGPLGETTQSAATLIWLSAGEGKATRYIAVSVNPVTGLATVGSFSGYGPGTLVAAPGG